MGKKLAGGSKGMPRKVKKAILKRGQQMFWAIMDGVLNNRGNTISKFKLEP